MQNFILICVTTQRFFSAGKKMPQYPSVWKQTIQHLLPLMNQGRYDTMETLSSANPVSWGLVAGCWPEARGQQCHPGFPAKWQHSMMQKRCAVTDKSIRPPPTWQVINQQSEGLCVPKLRLDGKIRGRAAGLLRDLAAAVIRGRTLRLLTGPVNLRKALWRLRLSPGNNILRCYYKHLLPIENVKNIPTFYFSINKQYFLLNDRGFHSAYLKNTLSLCVLCIFAKSLKFFFFVSV